MNLYDKSAFSSWLALSADVHQRRCQLCCSRRRTPGKLFVRHKTLGHPDDLWGQAAVGAWLLSQGSDAWWEIEGLTAGWILVLYEYARWHFSISVPGRAIECSHQWGYWGGNFGIEMLDFYLHPKFSNGTVILYWYSTVSTLILVCFTSALRTQTFQGPAIDRYGRVGLKRGWACRDTMRESCRVRLTCCLVCTV